MVIDWSQGLERYSLGSGGDQVLDCSLKIEQIIKVCLPNLLLGKGLYSGRKLLLLSLALQGLCHVMCVVQLIH